MGIGVARCLPRSRMRRSAFIPPRGVAVTNLRNHSALRQKIFTCTLLLVAEIST
jgi:hypothetical protein